MNQINMISYGVICFIVLQIIHLPTLYMIKFKSPLTSPAFRYMYKKMYKT